MLGCSRLSDKRWADTCLGVLCKGRFDLSAFRDGPQDPIGDSCPAPDTFETHYLIELPPHYDKLTGQVTARKALSESV